jgi:hypothetical protein
MHVCACVRMHVPMHVCTYVRMYVCLYVCTYVCMGVECMYMRKFVRYMYVRTYDGCVYLLPAYVRTYVRMPI